MRLDRGPLATVLLLRAVTALNASASTTVSNIDIEPLIPSYDVELHDCPTICADYSNTHSWTPYLKVNRLRRCQEPLLLQLSVRKLLENPNSIALIRTCSIASDMHITTGDAELPAVENPKKSETVFESSLEVAPACVGTGTKALRDIELYTNSGSNGNSLKTVSLLDGMQTYFATRDNCDESTLFAYHNGTAVGLFIGENLGKSTVETVLRAVTERLGHEGLAGNRTIAQLCGDGHSPKFTFGIAIDTTGNLVSIQNTVSNWSKGICNDGTNLPAIAPISKIGIMEITSGNSTNVTFSGNDTSIHNGTLMRRGTRLPIALNKRATCRYVEVVSGDGCGSLASRCGISGEEFMRYNSASGFCSGLQVGDYACCSSGDRYTKPKPQAPSPNADGTCATHIIVDNDTCNSLAKRYGVSEEDLEKWNRGKTWAWTECKDMLQGYNMCISSGNAPLPPPQSGTACGPLVPGTKPPTNGQSLADLNPCPLNACCSNWGFCGVFPGHCDIHAPANGGPGTKLPGFQNTCVSNCGNEIKSNSGPPSAYARIGYYESWNFNRDCLWMKARNANTDGSYTHMHWGFADIDPNTWKPIITDPHNQWQDFKKLNLKRIVSFGGWAYSTEPATYSIIRQAIIDNRDTFARNLAQFVKDEGIDGIDIDWEYPGAPDIMVGGSPIGKDSDGLYYLRFLTLLKSYIGSDKSVSIAAPASFWYLKAFPIQKISDVIDYIVYMTYDLHGQWDYGNPNSFDQCESGKCIRSHVNLTETNNALSMITKAGVANNKIFVGEASYGRTFRMATDGCWGPMCDFTGSRTQSDAKPGRCTKTGGYLAYAEIAEIQSSGQSIRMFHDDDSSSDIMLYEGDYVSYMTPEKKDQRREKWKGLNFAGTIDWAVDLQFFGDEDIDKTPDRPTDGTACIAGEDVTTRTGDLCEFSCYYGFCPESMCQCTERGDFPAKENVKDGEYRAIDDVDVAVNQLCNFACKRDFCPARICEAKPKVEFDEADLAEENHMDVVRRENDESCIVYKNFPGGTAGQMNHCMKFCKEITAAAQAAGRTSNYGCIGFWPGEKKIPWAQYPGYPFEMAPGRCACDNWLLNEVAETVLEAMPMIAQIGCYIIMSSLKAVLDIGLQFIPGVGKGLDAGLDMATTAAQMAAYLYPDGEKPEDAFSWWLSPCGGTELVPDEIKKIFDILSMVTDGVSSFKRPRNLKKGSGKKGDNGNPHDQSTPRSTRPNNNNNRSRCRIPKNREERRMGEGKNTIRRLSCDRNDKTQTNDEILVKAIYAANAKPTQIQRECPDKAKQACYHYESAIRQNPKWSTLTCPPEAAATSYRNDNGDATSIWSEQHNGKGWMKNSYYNKLRDDGNGCQRDEYPPAYLLNNNDPAVIMGGLNHQGQIIRYLPGKENGAGGKLWKGICFLPLVEELSDQEVKDWIAKDKNKKTVVKQTGRNTVTEIHASFTAEKRPEFTITKWPSVPAAPPGRPTWTDGVAENPCWHQAQQAEDPGFQLFTWDNWYNNNQKPYDYKKEYKKGSNGS